MTLLTNEFKVTYGFPLKQIVKKGNLSTIPAEWRGGRPSSNPAATRRPVIITVDISRVRMSAHLETSQSKVSAMVPH